MASFWEPKFGLYDHMDSEYLQKSKYSSADLCFKLGQCWHISTQFDGSSLGAWEIIIGFVQIPQGTGWTTCPIQSPIITIYNHHWIEMNWVGQYITNNNQWSNHQFNSVWVRSRNHWIRPMTNRPTQTKKARSIKKRRLRMVWTPQTTETALAIVNKNSHDFFRETKEQQIRTYTSDPKCSSSIVSQHFCSMSAQTFCNLGPGTLSCGWLDHLVGWSQVPESWRSIWKYSIKSNLLVVR